MVDQKVMTKAEQAAFHIVRRVQSDSAFAWVMMGTESLALCMAAAAEYRGEPEENLREFVDKNAASRRETPEIVLLRERVKQLEARLDGTLNERDDDKRWTDRQYRALRNVDELLHFAKLGVETPTAERLERALAPLNA